MTGAGAGGKAAGDKAAGDMSDVKAPVFAPLVLAYVGDSVYELFVRSALTQKSGGSVHKLHTEATKYTRCASQAETVHAIYDKLTEGEKDIVRRGRNTNSGYVPKNADVAQYRYATGFEALIGHLFLSRDFVRLKEVLGLAEQAVKGRAEANKTDDKKQTR